MFNISDIIFFFNPRSMIIGKYENFKTVWIRKQKSKIEYIAKMIEKEENTYIFLLNSSFSTAKTKRKWKN